MSRNPSALECFSTSAERVVLTDHWLRIFDAHEADAEEWELIERIELSDELDGVVGRWPVQVQPDISRIVSEGTFAEAVALRSATADLTPEEIIHG